MKRTKTKTALKVYDQWHEFAKTEKIEEILQLYREDAVLETPLIPVLLKTESGILKGHEQLRYFFEEGVKRRPNELVQWYNI